MNRTERHRLCGLLAQWEWIQGGNVSECVARTQCGDAIRDMFNITDAELLFYRSWEIYFMLWPQGEQIDLFLEFIEDTGYDVAVDLLNEGGRRNSDALTGRYDAWLADRIA